MITLCIRYTIDQNQYRNFEEYVRALPEPIRRCGGELVGYFLHFHKCTAMSCGIRLHFESRVRSNFAARLRTTAIQVLRGLSSSLPL